MSAEGMGLSLGLSSDLEEERFCDVLLPLLESPEHRLEMGRVARRTVDGKGAKRIASLIVGHLKRGKVQ
jgi:hypothetical protein